MTSLRSILPLSRDTMRGVKPSDLDAAIEPKFEWINPRELFVEEAYQRDLSPNSTALIRRIVAGFHWSRFKAPICVRLPETGDVLVIIDGQHTAIAAATHPQVARIPVMVIEGADARERAHAFVGHNRDRLALTQMAIFHAEVAAGDAIAIMAERACERTGAKILHYAVNLKNKLPAGQTIAVGTIRKIALRDGEEMLVRVLGLLTRAGRGPIKADEINAVHMILKDASSPVQDDLLRNVIASKSAEKWKAIASGEAADTTGRLSAQLASLWCRELGIRLGTKSDSPKHAPIAAKPKPAPIAPKAAPVAPKRPISAPKPIVHAPKPPDPAPPPPRPAPVPGVPQRWNNIDIEVGSGMVAFAGKEAVTSSDCAALVLMLARVMPNFLDQDFIRKKLGLDQYRLYDAIAQINRDLEPIGLQAKKVMSSSVTLTVLADA